MMVCVAKSETAGVLWVHNPDTAGFDWVQDSAKIGILVCTAVEL